ncbi:hypothetical protein CVT26_004874 [Gymnopilus dilepis]|uniref:Uncharacterized protein n=1 Tax=Gymnopilus dilepis TaxID=231916 RepID=A0A409W8F7_9AGAR|nr:hypothetical protein CVT26_004874 [Gymnopilus dilepis]
MSSNLRLPARCPFDLVIGALDLIISSLPVHPSPPCLKNNYRGNFVSVNGSVERCSKLSPPRSRPRNRSHFPQARTPSTFNIHLITSLFLLRCLHRTRGYLLHVLRRWQIGQAAATLPSPASTLVVNPTSIGARPTSPFALASELHVSIPLSHRSRHSASSAATHSPPSLLHALSEEKTRGNLISE